MAIFPNISLMHRANLVKTVKDIVEMANLCGNTKFLPWLGASNWKAMHRFFSEDVRQLHMIYGER